MNQYWSSIITPKSKWYENYKILSSLCEGGMATVYLAHDSKFDTNVATNLKSFFFTYFIFFCYISPN